MATRLVGIFDDYTQAQSVVQELTRMGVSQTDVSIVRNDETQGYTSYGGANSRDYSTGTGIGDRIAGFFENLFGGDVDETDRGLYSEAVRRGSTVVTARVEDNMADKAANIMNRFSAVDVDRRAAQYRASGYTSFDANAPRYTAEQSRAEFDRFRENGEIALPVIEEELHIGKRAVQRGGVRVHTSVGEVPVEDQVSLREEHVTVERRPANQPIDSAYVEAFKEGVIEVTETREEAVISKQARVVEEVVVGKEVQERTETVRDTVRRTDVDVEQLNPDIAPNRRDS